jgi:uncharacterized protein (TIGR03067 family)
MKRHRFKLTLISVVTIAFTFAAAADPPGQQAKLKGVWQLSEESCRGYPFAKVVDGIYSVNFSSDTKMTSTLDKRSFAYVSKVDWTKTPATIDLVDRGNGDTSAGILRFSAGRLVIAWATQDTARPRSFDVNPNSIVMTFDRKLATTRPVTQPATMPARR